MHGDVKWGTLMQTYVYTSFQFKTNLKITSLINIKSVDLGTYSYYEIYESIIFLKAKIHSKIWLKMTSRV